MSMFYLTNYDQLDVGQWHEVLMSDVEKIGCTLAGVLPKRIKPCWSMSLESWGHMGPYVATLFALCKNNRLFLDLDRNIKEHAKSVMILRDFFWEETGPPSSIHFPNEPSSPTFQTAHICHCHFTEMSLQRVKWPQKNQAKQHGSFVSYCTTTNALAYKKNFRKPGSHVRTHVVNARARVSQKYPFSSAMVKVNRQVRICI